jgi:hypothetical protein
MSRVEYGDDRTEIPTRSTALFWATGKDDDVRGMGFTRRVRKGRPGLTGARG